jgi:uncharacterized protein (TIGR03545 family)
MIRWSYVMPRLVLLAAIVLALWVGLNPLVHWAIVSAGQSAALAKVEIGKVETSLWRTELRLTDVCVANPQSPMHNLVEADQITLALDRDALLRKKYVVREGRVRGLRLGTDRDASGALDVEWNVELPQLPLAGSGQEWLDQLAEILEQELLDQAEKLESVQLVKELIERWPREYEQMGARADSLKGRIDHLRRLSESREGNPLRVVETCQQAAAEIETIQSEMAELRGEIDRLARQVLLDRNAVVRAKNRDVETIRNTLRVENLNGEAFSEYLLGPELSETVLTVAKWADWGRKYLPGKTDAPEPVRSRGVDVLLPGVRQYPGFLIESLALDGEGELGGRRFRFAGTATGITTQPEIHGQPLVFRAQVDAGTAVAVEAVIDRTGEAPHDRITISCPRIEQPERVLGTPGRLALVVSPSQMHLWASFDLKGESLSGQVLVRQTPVELVPDLSPAYGGPRLAESLEVAMREIRELRVAVDLSGTLKKPGWQLRSNLGPQLASALDGLLRRELEARREQLAAYVEAQVEGQLAQLERAIASQQQALLAKLDLDNSQIERLHQAIARRLQLPDALIDQGLPEGLPFRF